MSTDLQNRKTSRTESSKGRPDVSCLLLSGFGCGLIVNPSLLKRKIANPDSSWLRAACAAKCLRLIHLREDFHIQTCCVRLLINTYANVMNAR